LASGGAVAGLPEPSRSRDMIAVAREIRRVFAATHGRYTPACLGS
jgi:hypothetical protein